MPKRQKLTVCWRRESDRSSADVSLPNLPPTTRTTILPVTRCGIGISRRSDEIIDPRGKLWPACECPDLVANPSDIAADPKGWIAANGDRYLPLYYTITAKIDATKEVAVANVSNRGVAATGERTLITGLIVTGGEPRNFVIRALGPSLSASGVQQVCTNPQISIFNESSEVAANADWKSDSRSAELRDRYPTLAPANDKEAAVLVTLMPGAYTIVSANEDSTEGVVAVEAYDVDVAR